MIIKYQSENLKRRYAYFLRGVGGGASVDERYIFK
jgi:hypothetical protein